jgi:hypothetical protein
MPQMIEDQIIRQHRVYYYEGLNQTECVLLNYKLIFGWHQIRVWPFQFGQIRNAVGAIIQEWCRRNLVKVRF